MGQTFRQAPQRMHASISSYFVPIRFRPAVLEEDDVKLVRPVLLPLPPRPRDQLRVARQALAGTAPSEQLEERREISERRHEPLDPGDRDVHLRQRRDEPRVPLVRHRHDRPGLGNREVRAGHAHVRIEEDLPELAPGRPASAPRARPGPAGPRPARRARRPPPSSSRSPARRCEPGARRPSWRMYSPRSVSTGRMPAGLERIVQADLLGRHRLRLGDELRVVRAGRPRRRTRRPPRRSRRPSPARPAPRAPP